MNTNIQLQGDQKQDTGAVTVGFIRLRQMGRQWIEWVKGRILELVGPQFCMESLGICNGACDR